MGKNKFDKSSRLTSNADFRRVLGHKCCYRNTLISLYIADNDCGKARLGISLGKKVGSAVVRNRLKRLGREAFRQCREKISTDIDYLLIFQPGLSKKSKSELMKIRLDDVVKAFMELAQKHKKA